MLGIDEPLEVQIGRGSYYYSADGLSSVVAMTDNHGTTKGSYTYDAFGNNAPPEPPPPPSSVTNPFRYTGRELDSETGLYYYRARYYDPSTGRFLSEDPIRFRSAPNFYPYVHNRPTVLRDSTGLLAWGSGVGVAGMIGALMAGGGGDVSCLVVGDTQGNSGLLCCGGVGGGVVEGASLSVQAVSIVCPNCRTICDMEGTFVQVQGFGGLGETGAGGLGASMSSTSVAVVASGGGGVGAGAGVVVLGGDCKLKLGGKTCKKCPSQK